MQQLESDLDITQEKLMNANQRLEEKEKALLNAEGEVAASIVAFKTSKRIWKNQKRGCSLPHKNWTKPQQLVTILNVCAKSSKTKACQMKPEWKPS